MNKHSNILRTAADFTNHFMGESPAAAEFDLADYLRGVANLKTTPAVRNALSTGTDTAGGFSVPSILMPGIMSDLVPQSACLQAGAGVIFMADGAKQFTTAQVAANPTPAWRLEGGAVATSDPAFNAYTAKPKSLAFMFRVSRELLADGVGLATAFNRSIAQSFAKELDRVALRGSGVDPEPLGLRSMPLVQVVANGANGFYFTNYQPLLESLVYILQMDAPRPTAAIMNPKTMVGFGSRVDAYGQPLQRPFDLVGLPLISSTQVPNNITTGATANTTEVYMGDFTLMNYVMREGVSIQPLNELFAGTGEVAFLCHVRADVLVTRPEGFVVQTGLY